MLLLAPHPSRGRRAISTWVNRERRAFRIFLILTIPGGARGKKKNHVGTTGRGETTFGAFRGRRPECSSQRGEGNA